MSAFSVCAVTSASICSASFSALLSVASLPPHAIRLADTASSVNNVTALFFTNVYLSISLFSTGIYLQSDLRIYLIPFYHISGRCKALFLLNPSHFGAVALRNNIVRALLYLHVSLCNILPHNSHAKKLYTADERDDARR